MSVAMGPQFSKGTTVGHCVPQRENHSDDEDPRRNKPINKEMVDEYTVFTDDDEEEREDKEQIKKAKNRKKTDQRKKCGHPHSGKECGRENTQWARCRNCTWRGPGRPAKYHGADGRPKSLSLTTEGASLCLHGMRKWECRYGCPGNRSAKFKRIKNHFYHPRSNNDAPPPGWVQSCNGAPWAEMSAGARASAHHRHRAREKK